MSGGEKCEHRQVRIYGDELLGNTTCLNCGDKHVPLMQVINYWLERVEKLFERLDSQ